MRLSKKVIACLLALTVVLTALPIALTTSAAAATGINSTLYYMPTYTEILKEDGNFGSVSFENNTKFDDSIDEMIRTSYLTETKTGITDVNCKGDDDWFFQKWTGTMTATEAGTYYLIGRKIDNGFVMFVNGTKVYEYWGASHWFEGADDRLMYNTGFTVETGKEYEVEIYFMELGGGNALEIYATTTPDDVNSGSNINDAFDFALTEERYVIGDNTGEFNALVGIGTAVNGSQCEEANWKYDESIDKILAKAVKGESKVVASFNDAIISRECYVVLYDGYLVPAESGTYQFGANKIDNGFYLNIDGTVAYEFWAGNTWNDDGSGNTYPTGVELEAGKAYPFTAAFLETNGSEALELVASVDGGARTSVNMLFTYYTEKPEEIVEELIPTLAATDDKVLASVDFVNAPVNATVDPAIPVNDKGVATFTDNAITFDPATLLPQVNGELIIEMVIKPAEISNQRVIMSIGNSTTKGEYAVMGMRQEGGIVNALKLNETVTGNNVLTVGQWVTVKYVLGKGGSAIYVNGELATKVEAIDVTKLAADAASEMKFGQYTIEDWVDAPFVGQVSEIRLSTPVEAYVEKVPALEATSDKVLAKVDFENPAYNATVDAGVEVANGVATMNDDLITFVSDEIFGAANDSVTIEMVIKLQEFYDNGVIMSVGNSGATEKEAVQEYAVMGMMADGRIKLNTPVGSANTLLKGVWSTVKYVLSNDGGQVWVDGVQVGTVNPIDLDSLVGAKMNFGRYTVEGWADAAFVGQVSEIRITTPRISEVENTGAQMRVDGTYGLRFKASLDAELAEDATYGMLILPEYLLGDAELTKESDKVMDIEAKVNYGVAANGDIEYTGVVTQIPERAFDMNLVARAYVTYLNDAGEEVTEYAAETQIESYKGVATKIYEAHWSDGSLSEEVLSDLEDIIYSSDI